MKTGIKVGPDDGIEILKKTKPECCEVWFRFDWQKKYQPLFVYLKKKNIPFGLHFWAMVENRYFPNLLTLEKDIAVKTFILIKKTIDKACEVGATYVNFHPESYRLSLLNLNNSTIKVLAKQKKIKKRASFKKFLFYLEKIKKYADKKNVIAYIETVPKFAPANFADLEKGRLKRQKTEGLETKKFFILAEMGFDICFDLGHTIGQSLTKKKKALFNYLYQTAKKLKPKIGLIHINTVLPPFNGTDSHNGILDEDFTKGVMPTKKQLVKLLSLFKGKDVWLIPEPEKEKMVKNYFALKKIVSLL